MSYGYIAAVHSSTNWGLWSAVAAVIADSIITMLVGWRLTKTAKKESAKAVETIKPALQIELGNAAVTLIPVIVEAIKKHLSEESPKSVAPGTVRSISDKSSTVSG